MKLNQHSVIRGEKVVLVPYRKEHVEKYHVWMASKELQQLTASEPLSLEEEYAMQRSWAEDENKCTFIVLSRELLDKNNGDEVAAMIGDVNLFFSIAQKEQPTSGDAQKVQQQQQQQKIESAEIEVMIAEPAFRRAGCGLEATLGMMKFGVEIIGVPWFEAKIDAGNEPSLKMFREKLNFLQTGFASVFNEVHLKWNGSAANHAWLTDRTQHFKISNDA